MRITLLFILSIVFSLNAFGQSAEYFQNDNEGNVIAIFGNQDSTDQNVTQKGAENMFFIYIMQDSSAGEVEANQRGFSNRIISIIAEGKSSFFQRFDQKGERNKIQVLQQSTQDSISKGINKIDIKQKGIGNSVTIIKQ
jgi:lysyl-tRNA synthetase class II